MNIHSSLIAELRDKKYRDAYVASQIHIGLPFQVRALRQSRDLRQEDLAELAGMSQPRIAEIEKPGKRKFNIDTLLRIASALDVGLEVHFVPISTIIDHRESFDPDSFEIPTFEEELEEAERQERAAQAREKHFKDINKVAAGPPLTLVHAEKYVHRQSEPKDQLSLKFQHLWIAASRMPSHAESMTYPCHVLEQPSEEGASNPWQQIAEAENA